MNDPDNGVLHMAVLSKKTRVAPSLTTEERQRRMHEEIRNLRISMRHLMSDETPAFAVRIELRELELASLRERPPNTVQESANARPDAA